MSRNRRTQRTLIMALALVACFQTVASFAQVNDEASRDDQAPQGVRDSAVDRVNAEALAWLKGPKDYLTADEQVVEKWREMKFGLFIHWGPISILGEPIGWSRGGERRGWRGKGHVPVEVYDNLYRRFNPVEFNADQWVQMAKDRERMIALRRQIEEMLRNNGTLDQEIRGGTLDKQMFEGFKDRQAEQLRGQYIRLNMFNESWIPTIKAGIYGRFELFDLAADPSQKTDVSTQHPELFSDIKQQLLEIHASVMADAPDWHMQ